MSQLSTDADANHPLHAFPASWLPPVQPIWRDDVEEQCIGAFLTGRENIYSRGWATMNCSEIMHNITVICEDRGTNVTVMYDKFIQNNTLISTYLTSDHQWKVPQYYCPFGSIKMSDFCMTLIYDINKNNQCSILSDRTTTTDWSYIIEKYKHIISYDINNKLLQWAVCSLPLVSIQQITGVYKCNDSTLIVDHFVCDGELDCPDGSDEENCQHVCHFTSNNHINYTSCFHECYEEVCKCDSLYFHCISSSRCLPLSRFCDGIVDCSDNNEDEILCTKQTNQQNVRKQNQVEHFQCTSGHVIDMDKVNDTMPDCPFHGDDELIPFQDKTVITVYDNSSVMVPCIAGHPKLFPVSAICQLLWDLNGELSMCRNGAHLTNCIHHSCPHQFKCPYSYCIPVQAVCDGIMDCPHGSDEAMCNTSKHCPDLFQCKGPTHRCIHVHDLNNGVVNCPFYKDDEVKPGILHCPKYCTCIHHAMRCTNIATITEMQPNTTALVLRLHGKVKVKNYLKYFSHLKYLDISLNQEMSLEKSLFVQLTSLLILKLLNVSQTILLAHQFVGLHHLKELHFYGNSIQTLQTHAFDALSALTNLDLSQMDIHVIQSCAFKGLLEVQILNLSVNALTTLKGYMLCGLEKLNVLDLRGNVLSDIDPMIFQSSQLSLQSLFSDVTALCCYAVSVEYCIPKYVDVFSSCSNILHNVIIRYWAWLTTFVSITENTFSMLFFNIVNVATSDKKRIHNMNRNSLMLSDFLMGVYFLALCVFDGVYEGNYAILGPQWRQGWQCQMLSFISMLSFQMSLFMALVLALERFVAICFPLKDGLVHIKITGIIIVCMWLLGSLISLLPIIDLYIYNEEEEGLTNALCVSLVSFSSFSVWLIVLVCSVNTLIIVLNAVLYSSVIRVILNRKKLSATSTGSKKNKMERAITTRIVCLIVANSCSWMIIFLVGVLQISGSLVSAALYSSFAVALLPVSTIVNPLLNCYTTGEFRRMINHVKRKLCG